MDFDCLIYMLQHVRCVLTLNLSVLVPWLYAPVQLHCLELHINKCMCVLIHSSIEATCNAHMCVWYTVIRAKTKF